MAYTNRDLLADMGHNDLTIFADECYDAAIIGFTPDDQVVYLYEKMVEGVMERDGCTYDEAADYVCTNTIGYASRDRSSPIVMYGLMPIADEDGDDG